MTTTTVEVITAESSAIEAASSASGRAGEILLEARAIIVNAETYDASSGFLRGIKSLSKKIEEERDALVRPLNGVVKRINDRFRPAKDALDQAETEVKKKLVAYQVEADRVRREAERIAAEAQRRAEEKLRQEAEAARAAEQDALARAEAARAAGDTAAAKAAEIEAARKASAAERREQKADIVAMSPVVVAAPEPAKAAGQTLVERWSAEVVDIKALCAAVVAGTVPPEAVCANDKYLGQVARSLKGSMSWPGVKWVRSTGMAVR